MIKVNLEEAEAHLGRLIEEAAKGQEVLITSAGGSTVRLVPQNQERRKRMPPLTTERSKIGNALDRFIGTWSAEQEAEVLKAIEVFERVDESFWHSRPFRTHLCGTAQAG